MTGMEPRGVVAFEAPQEKLYETLFELTDKQCSPAKLFSAS